MIFNPHELSSRMSLKTQHSEEEWFKSLESARHSLGVLKVDQQTMENIAKASSSPAEFTVVARLIYQHGKSYPHGDQILELLLRYVNSYPFSLADWISSTNYFHGWLIENKRKIDFLPMIKYLECCAAAPEAKETGQTLLALVQDMLKHFDYEAG